MTKAQGKSMKEVAGELEYTVCLFNAKLIDHSTVVSGNN